MHALFQVTAVNGKPLSKTQVKTLAKIAKMGMMPAQAGIRANPYTGVTRDLDPLAATLHDFIINGYHAGMVGNVIPMPLWNEARYFFMAIGPDEYYALID
jgi:hypothetical protein